MRDQNLYLLSIIHELKPFKVLKVNILKGQRSWEIKIYIVIYNSWIKAIQSFKGQYIKN